MYVCTSVLSEFTVTSRLYHSNWASVHKLYDTNKEDL